VTRRLPLDGVPLAQRPPQVTLSDAQRRIAAVCPGLTIDWARPSEEALRVLLRASDLCLRRAEVEAVYEALAGLAEHLAFEAGRAFELAAVRRAAQFGVGADDAMDGDAFLRFDHALANGYHHAEPDPAEKPTPQMGDVWRIGALVASDAEVRCVHAETGNLTVSALHGDRRHKVVSAAKFTSNRRLVRRDGKAV
jgi:hypothetical protein